MTIEIPEAVIRAMEGHARETYPEECCGFLIGHATDPRKVVEARRARNAAKEERRRRYSIDPLELLRADDAARVRSLDLIGVYHSHPDHIAAPSAFDRDRATSWYVYLILSVRRGTPGDLTAWTYDEGSSDPHPVPIVRN